LLGPTLTAASTLSTEKPPFDRCRAQSRTDPRAVKVILTRVALAACECF